MFRLAGLLTSVSIPTGHLSQLAARIIAASAAAKRCSQPLFTVAVLSAVRLPSPHTNAEGRGAMSGL